MAKKFPIPSLALVIVLLAACATSNHRPLSVETPHGRLYMSDGGSGPALPVLFVHGSGGNLTQWQAQLVHLRKNRRAVAFDLRGMGASQAPMLPDYSVPTMAQDLAAVADALRLERFVLVGHSYGGAVVAAYAAEHPERVAGVVYVDSTGDVKISDEQMEKFLNELRADRFGVVRKWWEPILANASSEVKEAVLKSVDYTSIEAFTLALDGMRAFDMGRALAAYRGPKVAIAPADSTNEFSLHTQFPEVPLRTIRNVSHWLMMDNPAEFNRVLDEFLARVARNEPSDPAPRP